MKYFFNDKQREMGVDVNFIQKQMDEKTQSQQQATEQELQHRQQLDSLVDRLHSLHEDREKLYAQRRWQTGEYQRTTRVQDTDTFDLNDPKRLSKDCPPRTDDQQHIPTSAIQKFAGEDLEKPKRVKSQQAELQRWCQQIENEKKSLSEQERAAMAEYIAQRNQHLSELERVEAEKELKHKAETVACSKANFNESQVVQCQREQARKKGDLQEKASEIEQMMQSPFLNETWQSTVRCDNAGRFIPYHFKGFSTAQKQAILDKQARQMEQKENARQQCREKENAYYQQQQQYSRQALLELRQKQRLLQQRETQMAQVHKQQMKDTEQQRKELNELYANQVTPGFFQQFQTTTR